MYALFMLHDEVSTAHSWVPSVGPGSRFVTGLLCSTKLLCTPSEPRTFLLRSSLARPPNKTFDISKTSRALAAHPDDYRMAKLRYPGDWRGEERRLLIIPTVSHLHQLQPPTRSGPIGQRGCGCGKSPLYLFQTLGISIGGWGANSSHTIV